MFIQNLDEKQQSALLYLAKEIINADNKLHNNEASIYTLLESQVHTSVAPESIKTDELNVLFKSNISKISLLLELIAVAHADGDYHNDENVLIRKYAKTLNISEEKLSMLERWVSKQLSLSIEAQELFNQ